MIKQYYYHLCVRTVILKISLCKLFQHIIDTLWISMTVFFHSFCHFLIKKNNWERGKTGPQAVLSSMDNPFYHCSYIRHLSNCTRKSCVLFCVQKCSPSPTFFIFLNMPRTKTLVRTLYHSTVKSVIKLNQGQPLIKYNLSLLKLNQWFCILFVGYVPVKGLKFQDKYKNH